jgi:hypothetical protein
VDAGDLEHYILALDAAILLAAARLPEAGVDPCLRRLALAALALLF